MQNNVAWDEMLRPDVRTDQLVTTVTHNLLPHFIRTGWVSYIPFIDWEVDPDTIQRVVISINNLDARAGERVSWFRVKELAGTNLPSTLRRQFLAAGVDFDTDAGWQFQAERYLAGS